MISSCLSPFLSLLSSQAADFARLFLRFPDLGTPIPYSRRVFTLLTSEDAGADWRKRRVERKAICVAAVAAAAAARLQSIAPVSLELTSSPSSFLHSTIHHLQVSLATLCTSAAPRAVARRSSGRSASE